MSKIHKIHETDWWLCPIDSEARMGPRGILPLNTDQYIDLVDWTGRQISEDKPGAIPDHLTPILIRLEIDGYRWVHTKITMGPFSNECSEKCRP